MHSFHEFQLWTFSMSGVFFWAASGCPKLPNRQSANYVVKIKGALPPRCLHVSHGASIRCCSSPGACTSICEPKPMQATPPHQPRVPGVGGFAASHEQAATECAAIGMRLCTRQELASSMCCRTGCQADGALVWTADECTNSECARGNKQHCIARFRGSSTPGDTHWCRMAQEPIEADILLCSLIKDTLGSSLSSFISLATFVRVFQERTRLRVALQLPSLRDDAGGGEAAEWPIQTLYTQTSLQDVMPGVTLLGRGHAACTDRANELALNRVISVHPLSTARLGSVTLTSPSLTTSPSTFLQTFDRLALAGRAWANSSGRVGCPLRVFVGGFYAPVQCSVTAFPRPAAEVGRGLRLRSPSTRDIPPEVMETASRCAYVYFREAPVRGALRMTGPNPAGGVHCHTCPRLDASLAEVGAVLAQIITAANISCVGINSLPDASGGKAAVLHGLHAGASGADFRWLRFKSSAVDAADVNHLQMSLAAVSPLLITERGTLWSDGVGMARIASGRQTVVMHKKHARGKLLHEDVSMCRGVLIRGSCVKHGDNPYPDARIPCFD